MAWLKMDDKRGKHRKFRRQGFEARGLDEAAMCVCAHDETDGFISDAELEDLAHHHGVSLKRTIALATKLKDPMKRWDRDDGRGGWIVLGYLDFNPSHDELDAKRKRDRLRKKVPADSSGIPDGTDVESGGTP